MSHTTFHEALHALNIPLPPHQVGSERFTRWGKESRYYAIAVGNGYSFGDWVADIKATWFPRNQALTPAERKTHKANINAAQHKAEQLREERYERVARKAQAIWERLSEQEESAYCQRKQVGAYGIRFTRDGKAVIPLRDGKKLWNLQFIDGAGNKRFLAGGRKHGCFHTLGKLQNGKPIAIGEGYATAATGHVAADTAGAEGGRS